MESKTIEVFSISAKTCTLKYYDQENGDTILADNKKYIIPIYQRPYSWGDVEIRKFLSSIVTSFWGNDGNIAKESMFIGTMQLSDKKNGSGQDIIDGQQRLTTFLILLKVLKHRFPNCEELKDINLDWLSTRVNNGTQQVLLNEFLSNNLVHNDDNNPYLKNAFIINKIIDKEVKDEEDNSLTFDIDKFVDHLLRNIYFVVIETHAGLSKTLQIFNTINTTGLDLNGADIFKIKMYEYLTSIKHLDESSFDEISKLYKKIDDFNKDMGSVKFTITNILNIYQYILIAKYNLPNILYSFGTDTFFERLFDTIFKINLWEHFKNNLDGIELSLKDIERIIDVRCEWQNDLINKNRLTVEDVCALNFIWLSRYGRYWILAFVFLYKFKDEGDSWNKMLLFIKQLSKLYIIYSVRFQKVINEVHTFTYSLINDIICKSSEEVINSINKKIFRNYRIGGDFEIVLTGDIANNTKVKNIICRLSAMLEEDFQTNDTGKIKSIENSLFESKIDIEHIQSYNDSDVNQKENIRTEWGDNINSIGNLMVLERNKNQYLSNSRYEVKIKEYPSSSFSIVKKQVEAYSEWDLAKCKERKEKEKEKIIKYIFS